MERFSVVASAGARHVVLTAKGDLDLASAERLRRELDRWLTGVETVVVDCAGVLFVDSTGLRALLEASAKAAESGVRFRLAAVPPPVARVLELAGVARMFTVRGDVAAALAD